MISPFSLQHDWELFWKRLSSNEKVPEFIQCESQKEQKALNAIAKIGIIGGRHLFHLFSIDKKRLKKMEREKKIVRHELKRGNHIIPIYTLGLAGSIITRHSAYEVNHWVEYRLEDVLKRLLFFKFYEFFSDLSIIPAPEPFVGAINLKNNPLYVYIVRGDTTDLLNYLKWKRHTFNGRLIVITEDLGHIKPFIMHTKHLKMRITTDNDLLQSNSIRDLFYFLNKEGEIIKEAQ